MESYNKHVAKNDKVEFIHFSLDRSADEALAWAKSAKFPWPHVLPDKHDASALQGFAKKFVPYYMLVDKEGKVMAEGKQAVFDKVRRL